MSNPGDNTDTRVYLLSNLLSVEKEARQVETIEELAYVMANDTHRLIPYAQGVVLQQHRKSKANVLSVSSVGQHDKNAIYTQWLSKFGAYLIRQIKDAQPTVIELADLPSKLALPEGMHTPHILWCPVRQDEQASGLLLFKETPWQEPEIIILDSLLDSYRHAWMALQRPGCAWWKHLRKVVKKSSLMFVLAAALASSFFIPINLTALAPAEIVASKPYIVAAPMPGVVEAVTVLPNQAVKQGDVLFNLDSTSLSSERDIAKKALDVAKADYLRATQQVFGSVEAQLEIKYLKALVEERQSELAHAQSLLDRAVVSADRDGIAVFNDPDYWQGRPVQVGEKVMTLADSQQVELQIWLAVADAVALEPGAKVRLFLNVDPNNPLDAELYRTAYEPEQRPNQTMAFRLRARLADADELPRIGLKGTAKLYGESVTLAYYLFRRPYAATREFLGL